MVGAVFLFALLPSFITCSGEGNIHLLADEVAVALRACSLPNDTMSKNVSRQRRSEEYGQVSTQIDGNTKQMNQYGHERRNASDMRDQIHVLNSTDYGYSGYGSGNESEQVVNTVPQPAMSSAYNNYNTDSLNLNRSRRSETFLKLDSDQCLSQCVFANLQVVDSKGIPREAELWNKMQTAVTSQQSRSALRDQVRACYQELLSEDEDNGCSFSDKLERCMMLRFSDRMINGTISNNQKM